MRRHLWIFILVTSVLQNIVCAMDSHSVDNPERKEEEVESTQSQDTPPQRESQDARPTPTRPEILKHLAEGAVRSEERTNAVKAYIEALKNLSSEERQKAVEEFFKTTSMLIDRDDFFESMKDLPEEFKSDVEKGVLTLPPEKILGLLRFLSKEAQTKGMERVVDQTRKDPSLIVRVALVAERLSHRFSQQDLNRFVLTEKQYHPELLRQFSKNNPEGVKQLLEVFKKGGETGSEAFSAIAAAIQKGDIPLHSDQHKELKQFIEEGPFFSGSRDEAFKALKAVSPKMAQELVDEFSQSKDPKDLVTAAGFLGEKDPKAAELITRAFKTADLPTLDLISERFPGLIPKVEGFSPERLKLLAEWGLNRGESRLYEASLRELFSQKVSPGEMLPLIKRGLEESPGHTLFFLDSLKAEDAKKFEVLAPLVMSQFLKSIEQGATTGVSLYDVGVDFLSHFPKTIEPHAATLKQKVEGTWGDSVLKLLGATQNPNHLETYLAHINDKHERKSFAASEALGKLLSANPALATPQVEEKLRKVLEAKDEQDVARLHLRQHLPEPLMLRVDQQIFASQEKDPERAAAVLRKTTEAALEILKKEGIGLMGPGQRGLALEFLIRSGHQDAPRLVEEYLKTAFPKGYIHNVNSIQGVIQAAKQAGIPIDPEVLQKAQTRIEREARGLWNSGNPEMRERSQGSNLIPFGGAAYITSATDPSQLNQTQKDLLETLRKMRGQPVPYFFPTADEPKESGALLDRAPTSGRAVTSGLAMYLTASSGEKPEAARELLGATRTFLQHFSQTHEIPRASGRTHDRTPGGQQMAAYYGFANDPNAMVALMTLSKEPSLTQGERQEAARMASQLQTRLLTLTEKDGTIYRREQESFSNENLVYQILTGLSVVQGPPVESPQKRLLKQVP